MWSSLNSNTPDWKIPWSTLRLEFVPQIIMRSHTRIDSSHLQFSIWSSWDHIPRVDKVPMQKNLPKMTMRSYLDWWSSPVHHSTWETHPFTLYTWQLLPLGSRSSQQNPWPLGPLPRSSCKLQEAGARDHPETRNASECRFGWLVGFGLSFCHKSLSPWNKKMYQTSTSRFGMFSKLLNLCGNPPDHQSDVCCFEPGTKLTVVFRSKCPTVWHA